MVNYWIFNVKDDENKKYSRKGIEIYRHRMPEKFWGIREYTENGRRTANIGNLGKGDSVVFYLVGAEGRCFLGTCMLDSGFRRLGREDSKKITHEEYLDWEQGGSLRDIDPWVKRLSIERLRGKVSFAPDGENYGKYLQGSIKRISKKDYETIIHEHELTL